MPDSFELYKRGLHLTALQPDKRSLVLHLVAVVRSAEDRDDAAVCFNLVALHLHLVGADEDIEVVVV